MKVSTKIVNVTPAMASRWLAYNTRNRDVNDPRIAMFAADMKANRWQLTHQGLAFYEDGVLADGQHRLRAVVEAKVAVPFLVTTGLPVESGQSIDQNRPRQLHDAIKIAGTADWIDRNDVALIRFLIADMKGSGRAVSVYQVVEYGQRWKDPIQAVMSLATQKKKGMAHSGVTACYFCALVAGEPLEKLRRFATILYSGEIAGPHENAAIRLREYLMTNAAAWVGTNNRMDSCSRTMRAIQSFCKDEPLKVLRAPENYMYAVPK